MKQFLLYAAITAAYIASVFVLGAITTPRFGVSAGAFELVIGAFLGFNSAKDAGTVYGKLHLNPAYNLPSGNNT